LLLCKAVLTICLILISNVNIGEAVEGKEFLKGYVYVPKVYYPLYDSGRIVDKVTLKVIGKAKIADKYYDVVKGLLDSATKDGVVIKINSGYRTIEDQVGIRKKYSRDRSCRDDMNHILHSPSHHFYPETARPGHSRHHTGIAYDFNTKDPSVYRWLQRNAISHGFVRTVDTERWHWEYIPAICDPYYYVPREHWSWKISYKIKVKK
jgi:hypothetical protein